MAEFGLASIEEAIQDFKEGKFVIVVDDEDRENEGDLIMAAELVTPEHVNYMLRNGRGVLCAPITIEDAMNSNSSVRCRTTPVCSVLRSP